MRTSHVCRSSSHACHPVTPRMASGVLSSVSSTRLAGFAPRDGLTTIDIRNEADEGFTIRYGLRDRPSQYLMCFVTSAHPMMTSGLYGQLAGWLFHPIEPPTLCMTYRAVTARSSPLSSTKNKRANPYGIGPLAWAIMDSNHRLPACKAGALTN